MQRIKRELNEKQWRRIDHEEEKTALDSLRTLESVGRVRGTIDDMAMRRRNAASYQRLGFKVCC